MKQILIDKIQQGYAELLDAKRSYYSQNLYEFNKDVMGWPDIYEPLHKLVCDFVQDNYNKKKLLILLPRGTFKSSIITVGFTLWQIARNPSVRLSISNATYPMAIQFLNQIKNYIQRNEEFKKMFGDFSINADQWREDKIFVSREKSYAQKEATVSAYGMGANMVGSHFDIAIMDDIVARENIGTKDQIEKVKDYYKDVLDLIDQTADGHKRVIIIGCLVAGSRVLMKDGTFKNIEEVKVGEEVRTWRRKRKFAKVIAVVPQGKAKVYELNTGNHKIQATANHPFLREKGTGGKREFVRLDKLKAGDTIIYFNQKEDGETKISPELAWAYGYMMGDGWVTRHPNRKGSMRWQIGIAEGIYEDRNKKIIGIFEKEFGCRFKRRACKGTNYGSLTTYSAKLGRWLEELGFGKADTKSIPEWLFRQNLEIRQNFIKGFIDADGWKQGKRFYTELTNKELVEGLKELASISGIRTNNIYSRTRLLQPPNSKNPVISETYSVGFKFLPKKKNLEYEKVKIRSIKYVGEKDVWDLSVEPTHNFVANGLVVHNTCWHWDDLYAWIQNKENNLLNDFAVLKLPAFTGEWGKGELLFPTRLTWKTMQKLREQQGASHFSSQYLLNPIPTESQTFKPPFKHYEQTDLSGVELKKFVTIDPALSEEKEADFSAMVCVGVDKNNCWYILDIYREQVLPNRLIDQIFYWNEKWKPVSIGLETTAYQRVLQYQINDEMKKRNQFIPIKELGHQDRSKDDRIRGLQPRYETGTVFHPLKEAVTKIEYLEDELQRFPRGGNDDVVDALASQLELAFPPKAREERKGHHHEAYPA